MILNKIKWTRKKKVWLTGILVFLLTWIVGGLIFDIFLSEIIEDTRLAIGYTFVMGLIFMFVIVKDEKYTQNQES